MLESKPTSMPPSPRSRTIGNLAMTTISGMASSTTLATCCALGRRRSDAGHTTTIRPDGEDAEVEPAAARGEQRSQASSHGSSGSGGDRTSIGQSTRDVLVVFRPTWPARLVPVRRLGPAARRREGTPRAGRKSPERCLGARRRRARSCAVRRVQLRVVPQQRPDRVGRQPRAEQVGDMRPRYRCGTVAGRRGTPQSSGAGRPRGKSSGAARAASSDGGDWARSARFLHAAGCESNTVSDTGPARRSPAHAAAGRTGLGPVRGADRPVSEVRVEVAGAARVGGGRAFAITTANVRQEERGADEDPQEPVARC